MIAAWKLNSDDYKKHLVSEICDGNKKLIVYKEWWKYKQKWVYRVEPLWIIKYRMDIHKDTLVIYNK